MSGPVDVLSRLSNWATCEALLGGNFDKAHAIDDVRAAVAELIACNAVTVKAFEALGRTDNIVAQLESHRECERALVEQKAALARVQGVAP